MPSIIYKGSQQTPPYNLRPWWGAWRSTQGPYWNKTRCASVDQRSYYTFRCETGLYVHDSLHRLRLYNSLKVFTKEHTKSNILYCWQHKNSLIVNFLLSSWNNIAEFLMDVKHLQNQIGMRNNVSRRGICILFKIIMLYYKALLVHTYLYINIFFKKRYNFFFFQCDNISEMTNIMSSSRLFYGAIVFSCLALQL